MSACTHQIVPGGLICTREQHDDRGHVYVSDYVPDRHDTSEPTGHKQ